MNDAGGLDKMNIRVSNRVDRDEAEVFWKMLRDYNFEQVGNENVEELCITLRDEDGHIAVHETQRKQGYGSLLLRACKESRAEAPAPNGPPPPIMGEPEKGAGGEESSPVPPLLGVRGLFSDFLHTL